MLRVLLSPRWLGLHLLTIGATVAFVLLGLWQLGRFEDSGPRAQARADAPAVPLASIAGPDAALSGSAVGRSVQVSGRYQPGQLLVPGRELAGRNGYLVVAGLRTGSGALVAVLRGWVPAPPAPEPPPGQVAVRGVLEPSESDTDATVDPAAELPAGQIPYIGSDLLSSALNAGPAGLYEGYVTMTGEQPTPVAAPERVPPQTHTDGVGRWRNFAYALQWWIFAVAAVGLWGYGVREEARARASAADPATAEPTASG